MSLYVTLSVFIGGASKLVRFPRTGELLRLACFCTVTQRRDKGYGLPFLSITFSLRAKREKAQYRAGGWSRGLDTEVECALRLMARAGRGRGRGRGWAAHEAQRDSSRVRQPHHPHPRDTLGTILTQAADRVRGLHRPEALPGAQSSQVTNDP